MALVMIIQAISTLLGGCFLLSLWIYVVPGVFSLHLSPALHALYVGLPASLLVALASVPLFQQWIAKPEK